MHTTYCASSLPLISPDLFVCLVAVFYLSRVHFLLSSSSFFPSACHVFCLSPVLSELLVTLLLIFQFQGSLLHLTPQSPNLPSHLDVFVFPLYSLTSHLKPTSGSLFLCDSRRVSSVGLSAVQDLDEGFAKLDVESGVDDRVDSAVEVSQPGDGAVQWGRDAAAPAVGLQHVCQEERQPADDEHTLGNRDREWV